MNFLARTLAFGLAAIGATAVENSTHAATARPTFGLAQAFGGTTYGQGTFSAPLLGVSRKVSTTLIGTRRGKFLTVFEKINFADGERQRKTWRFMRTGPSTWIGERDDVVGQAQVNEENGVVTLRYDANVQSAALGTTTLSFYDTIYRGPRGTIINETTVSKFGVPVGSLVLTFHR